MAAAGGTMVGENDPQEPLVRKVEQMTQQLSVESERRSRAESEAHASRQELIEVQKEMEKTEALLEQEKTYSSTFREQAHAKEQVSGRQPPPHASRRQS